MTVLQAAETAGVSLAAGATTAGALISDDITGWLAWVVPIGASMVAGYYSAQISVRSEMSALKESIRYLGDAMERVEKSVGDSEGRVRHEVQTYYQRRVD